MASSLQNCAPGVFAFKYPASTGDEALGNAYCLAKAQVGDNILVPVLDTCSLECVSTKPIDSRDFLVLSFRYGEIDIDTIRKVYGMVSHNIKDTTRLICLPDSSSLAHMSIEELKAYREVIDTRITLMRAKEKAYTLLGF